MTVELSLPPGNVLQRMTSVGVVIPNDITPEQYQEDGAVLGAVHECVKFAIGDWLVAGQKIFQDDAYQYAEVLNLSPAQMMQYVHVAERIPIGRRVAGLTWSHHRSVSVLEPEQQAYWLQRSLDEGWSKNDLEAHLKHEREQAKGDESVRGRRYVVEQVAEIAERAWEVGEPDPSGEFYRVPVDVWLELGNALDRG